MENYNHEGHGGEQVTPQEKPSFLTCKKLLITASISLILFGCEKPTHELENVTNIPRLELSNAKPIAQLHAANKTWWVDGAGRAIMPLVSNQNTSVNIVPKGLCFSGSIEETEPGYLDQLNPLPDTIEYCENRPYVVMSGPVQSNNKIQDNPVMVADVIELTYDDYGEVVERKKVCTQCLVRNDGSKGTSVSFVMLK